MPSTGSGAAEPGAAKRVLDAVEALERDGHQALVSATLGHKADLGIMALGPDLARLQAFQAELAGAPLRLGVVVRVADRESEYTSTEEQERERLSSHAEGLDADGHRGPPGGLAHPHGQVPGGQAPPPPARRRS